jgi:hypothetical protein
LRQRIGGEKEGTENTKNKIGKSKKMKRALKSIQKVPKRENQKVKRDSEKRGER